MKKTNIIHIVLGKANPNRQNGVNKVVFELATNQSKNGHNVAVWGITRNPVVNYLERLFTTRLFEDSSLKFKISPELIKAINAVDEETVFHLHGAFLPQLFAVSRYLKQNQLDYIYTPHGGFNTEALKRSKWKKMIYIWLFEKSVVLNARFVHAIGKSEIEGTKSVFGAAPRIELIPNGHRPSTSIFPKIWNNGERTNFGFVGRLDIRTKGLDILLDGFRDFRQNGGNAVLHIAGSGADEEQVKSYVRSKGLADSVVFYGSLFGIYKDQFLSGIDYLCLTSRNEGLPGVVLEALETKIPCIVSSETNMGDVINQANAGFVLESNDKNNVEKALSMAVCARKNGVYTKLCANAKRLMSKRFQWSVISNELIQRFYEK